MHYFFGPICSRLMVIGGTCMLMVMAGVVAGQQQKMAAPAAKVPQVASVFPAGAARGATIDVEVKGKNLNTVTDLYFARPAASIQKLEAKGADRLIATLSIPPDTEPGLVELRAIGSDGISNLRFFRIDEFPEMHEQSDKHNTPALAQKIEFPVVMNGQLAAADVDCYRIRIVKPQKLAFEVESRRIGSPTEPRLRLLDDSGRLLAEASTTRAIRPDERMEYDFMTPGEYIVVVEDAQYVGGDGAVYRLRIGSWPYATAQFPLGGSPGQSIELTLEGGNLTAPVKHSVDLPSQPGAIIQPGLSTERGTLTLPMQLAVGYGDTELMEVEPNDDRKQPQEIAGPCVVNGRIAQPGDKDRFLIKAKKDERLTIEVFADRLGSWLDSVLTVNNRNGQLIVENDDSRPGNAQQNAQTKTGTTPISDARVEFKAPADGEYVVTVDDRYNSGGAEFAYRLVITRTRPEYQLAYGPAPPAKNQPQPKNQQNTPLDLVQLAPGKSAVVSVVATRRGYDGEIVLNMEGLPPGISCETGKIAAKQPAGQITLKAAPDAEPFIGRARVFGTAKIDEQDVKRFAQTEIIVAQIDALHTARTELSDIVVALVRNESPLALKADGETLLVRGLKSQIKVSIDRKAGFKGSVELKTDKLPKGVTAEKVTISENDNEAVVQLTADESTPIGKAKIKLVAQARRGATTVEASNEVALSVVMPFELSLAPKEKTLELVSGESRSIKLAIKRIGNFEGPVELTLDGLPDGITVTPDRIEADQDEVEINFAVDEDAKPIQAGKPVRIQLVGEVGSKKVSVEAATLAVTVKDGP